ncbi:phage virion morphogenesis protein [Stenoxybacter acetivorans]|uniref:phage virion morphogenesis protein n=1 Tax=Stenoxybacter acetivorans TaxID=422441 RepID=UPI000560C448|nr:phage virion morphogenesis protein [Stenoxybacter acetivorans]
MIEINLDSHELDKGLKQLMDNVKNTGPLMRSLAVELETMTKENFENEAWGSDKWTPRKSEPESESENPKKKKGKGKRKTKANGNKGKILFRSGEMADSVDTRYDSDSAQIGSNLAYAAIHHLGGKTAAHTIRAKNKKALSFNGIFRKSVNHPGSQIPARPYLPINAGGKLQSNAKSRLLDTALTALKKSL